jgi:hypothetical protein
VDTDEIAAEMQWTAADFRSLLDNGTSAELRRGSWGARSTGIDRTVSLGKRGRRACAAFL